MKVYQLEQATWNDQEVGDFNLPRDIGYYSTYELAEKAMFAHIESRRGSSDDEGWTSEHDYNIYSHEVKE